MVKGAKRSDMGPYTVTLKNPSGFAEATVKVTVLGNSLVINLLQNVIALLLAFSPCTDIILALAWLSQ